jgi:NAD(P)-dependent dehydrogenase (short-subunit alcohol dehydrogenase family)
VELELKDKVAIVTGGSRGIGKAIARQLAKEGASVALVARDLTGLESAVAEISCTTGSRVKGFAADTGNDAAVKAAVANVLAAFGRIDILVNCAAAPGGQAKSPTLTEITNEHFHSDMNVKVMGYLRTAREVAPHMASRRSGRVINIGGFAARHTGNIIGSIRNVGVAALTKNLADELGAHGISVVCVHPGRTRTEKTSSVVEREARTQGVSTETIEERMAAFNLIRRLITAEEVAYVVAFLASPKSVGINGDSISAGGGIPGSIHY